MKSGQIIKHKRAMDVCLLIDDIQGNVVSGSWINMGFVESFAIFKRSTFRILNHADWLTCKEPIEGCLRYAEWI